MEKAYDHARRESGMSNVWSSQYIAYSLSVGKGSDARRKATINAAVKRNGLFADLLKNSKRAFNEHADDAQESIKKIVDSHFESIRDTFDIIRSENIALECEKDPEFRSRVQARLKATKDAMERVCVDITTS
jgi:hypothetical protein